MATASKTSAFDKLHDDAGADAASLDAGIGAAITVLGARGPAATKVFSAVEEGATVFAVIICAKVSLRIGCNAGVASGIRVPFASGPPAMGASVNVASAPMVDESVLIEVAVG